METVCSRRALAVLVASSILTVSLVLAPVLWLPVFSENKACVKSAEEIPRVEIQKTKKEDLSNKLKSEYYKVRKIPNYKKELFCLTQTIYFEAGGMDENDMKAIAFVVMNRVTSDKWPNTICKVVWQRRQFSWTLRKNPFELKTKSIKEVEAWEKARKIAELVINGEVEDFTGGATHYYSKRIRKPRWARQMRETYYSGYHFFLKEDEKKMRIPKPKPKKS